MHFTAAAATTGTLSLTPGWTTEATDRRALATTAPAAVRVAVSLPAGASNQTVSVKAAAGDIKLWWPTGMGAQPLYDLKARPLLRQ